MTSELAQEIELRHQACLNRAAARPDDAKLAALAQESTAFMAALRTNHPDVFTKEGGTGADTGRQEK